MLIFISLEREGSLNVTCGKLNMPYRFVSHLGHTKRDIHLLNSPNRLVVSRPTTAHALRCCTERVTYATKVWVSIYIKINNKYKIIQSLRELIMQLLIWWESLRGHYGNSWTFAVLHSLQNCWSLSPVLSHYAFIGFICNVVTADLSNPNNPNPNSFKLHVPVMSVTIRSVHVTYGSTTITYYNNYFSIVYTKMYWLEGDLNSAVC